jgi:hypothetical protein
MAGVPIIKLLEYPRELTDAYWQKKKGVIAKTKSTGLGAELGKAEDLHKKIDTGKLHAGSDGPKNERELQIAYKAALVYFQRTVEPLRHQLHIVRDVAVTAQATLKKVPGAGSGAEAAADIAQKAAIFAALCKSIDMEGPVKDLQARFAVKTDLAAKAIQGSLKSFATGFRAYCASEQAPSDWNDLILQQGRAVSNALAQLEDYNKAFWAEFHKFRGFDLGTLKLNDETDESKEKRLSLAKAAAAQISAIAKFKSA